MKKASVIKAKIKKQKRIKRKNNITFFRKLILMDKTFIIYNSICIDKNKKISVKKIKKLKSLVKNWKTKRLILFYGSKNKKGEL